MNWMKEIGSEFWNVPITKKMNQLFPESTQWFLSGRSALNAIIQELKGCHTVEIPSWCCDSMIKPFLHVGMEVHFYPVYWKNGLVQEAGLDSDVLFILDYFGYTDSSLNLNGYKGIIIRDMTHSLFSAKYMDADYYFGSLRKWCGMWTGGYAWTRDGHRLVEGETDNCGYTSIRENAMRLKQDYIQGIASVNHYSTAVKGFLKRFNDAETILESTGIVSAADRDVHLAQKLDVEMIVSCRRTNAKILRHAFPYWLIFPEWKESDCPMFVPIFVPDGQRDKLRNYLVQSEIYCPIHWPVSRYHKLNERTEILYKNELSLVCDQRYTKEDMNRIVERINNFWKEVGLCLPFIH